MKIFLDVGAHTGQTLKAILDPKYQFDKIYAFEPVVTLQNSLKKISTRNKQVILCDYGLWNQNCIKWIYSPGSLGGSIYPDHESVLPSDKMKCKFRNASEWFSEHLKEFDEVYMKLNCEGAEIEILLDLCSSGEISKISNVLIDFDSKKVESLKNKDKMILQCFEKINFTNYSLVEKVMKGPTHLIRIQSWLDQTKALRKSALVSCYQFIYIINSIFRNKRPGFLWELKHHFKHYLPIFLLRSINARKN